MEFAHPAKKVLDKMNETQAQKIYDHIELLKRKPFRSSPGMNIDKLAGKQKPPAYRLKIDRIRVEYFVDGQMIVIFNISMKKRKSDYRLTDIQEETNNIMMASSKTRLPENESLTGRDFEGVISEGEETKCADKIWQYYETHKDELEDLDEYAKKRGLVKQVI